MDVGAVLTEVHTPCYWYHTMVKHFLLWNLKMYAIQYLATGGRNVFQKDSKSQYVNLWSHRIYLNSIAFKIRDHLLFLSSFFFKVVDLFQTSVW